MRIGRRVMAGVVGAALAVGTAVAPVRASDPVGIYGLIDRVVVAANAGTATTVQVWGTFAVAVTPPTSTYKPAEAYGTVRKGYMVFSCPEGRQAACTAEWNDLKSLAGKGDIAGFGTRWGTKPRVRAADEPAGTADVYAINIGVIKIGQYGAYPEIVSALQAASQAK